MLMEDEIEICCPHCGGYIYRYGIYEGDKPYVCVRCRKTLTRQVYEKLWQDEFSKRGGNVE